MSSGESAAPVGFDLDNTLIDSNPQVLASFAALAEESGQTIDIDAVRRRLGIKLEDELSYWFARGDIADAAAIYRRHYVGLVETTRALPGAREALAAVRSAGARAVIITAKHVSIVGACCAAAGLEADEVAASLHGREKAEAITRLGVGLYVGDTPADIEAAGLAGVRGVAVATGSFSVDVLRDAGASDVLTSLEAFPAVYARWRGEGEV